MQDRSLIFNFAQKSLWPLDKAIKSNLKSLRYCITIWKLPSEGKNLSHEHFTFKSKVKTIDLQLSRKLESGQDSSHHFHDWILISSLKISALQSATTDKSMELLKEAITHSSFNK